MVKQKNNSFNNFWPELIIYSCLVSSCLPKIIITEGVNIFFPEIILFISLLFNGITQYFKFTIQKQLLYIFGIIFIFSIFAQLQVDDMGAILQSIKEILYISTIYWAAKIKYPWTALKYMCVFGIIAMGLNILIFKTYNLAGELEIWGGSSTLSSGLVNRGISLSSFALEQLPGLAHGIWASYCILVFIISSVLMTKKKINVFFWLLVSLLLLYNISISVSRESVLILLIIIGGYVFWGNTKKTYKIIFIIIILVTFISFLTFGQELPIVKKLIYTQNSVDESGTEGSVQIRINTWITYFNYLSDNISNIFFGFGLSPQNFGNHIRYYKENKEIVDVPESAFVYTLAYGGIFTFYIFINFIYKSAILINNRVKYGILKYFFMGVLLTNVLSGVSMFSDLLYIHLCIVIGIFIFNKNFI